MRKRLRSIMMALRSQLASSHYLESSEDSFVQEMRRHSFEHKFWVYDSRVGENIPFSNQSDAEIASLALTHDIPSPYIDLFLDVVRADDFRADSLAFSSGVDIYLHVAAFREDRAFQRTKQYQEQEEISTDNGVQHLKYSSPVPQLVVELITDEFKKQYASRDYEDISLGASTASCTLSNMTLVHRLWTIPAQRALGSIVRLNPTTTRHVLRSPLYGSWTRRAYFLYRGRSNYSHLVNDLPADVVMNVKLLMRFFNV
jgi:hypothetical protein